MAEPSDGAVLKNWQKEQERERRRLRDRERRQSMTSEERERHLARRRKNYQLRRQRAAGTNLFDDETSLFLPSLNHEHKTDDHALYSGLVYESLSQCQYEGERYEVPSYSMTIRLHHIKQLARSRFSSIGPVGGTNEDTRGDRQKGLRLNHVKRMARTGRYIHNFHSPDQRSIRDGSDVLQHQNASSGDVRPTSVS